MTGNILSTNDLLDYYQERLKSVRLRAVGTQLAAMLFFGALAYFSNQSVIYFAGLISVGIIGVLFKNYYKEAYQRVALFEIAFPEKWKEILNQHVWFYKELDEKKKLLFEKIIQLFLTSKKIQGINTEVDDQVRLLVAASAIIPTFAFPAFDYPELTEVLIYPKSFSKEFEMDGANRAEENIEGMVGNRYMNHSLLLSKPALLAGFNGRKGEENVGIHEFVHLLDREDGEVDGVPERLAASNYTLPWMHLIKKEMSRIKKGDSDINPYAITNNAEFLAVVSEYFFNDPEEFYENHPELYSYLSIFYNQMLVK